VGVIDGSSWSEVSKGPAVLVALVALLPCHGHLRGGASKASQQVSGSMCEQVGASESEQEQTAS
jgi:hypothetical protein